MNKSCNILFGGNYKVYDGILLCLMSMVKHTKSELHVYILSADLYDVNPEYRPITEENRKFLEDYIKKTNTKSTVKLITLGQYFKDWVNSSVNKLSEYTPFAFLRLFMDRVPEIPSKTIYLDTDIMINGDIQELFDTDIEEYEIGAVLDRYGTWFIAEKYFNTGVLLINKDKIIESNLFGRTLDMCVTKKMAFPDQSALNKCVEKIIYLPRKFNEQGNLRKDTVVQHFSKRIKWLPFFHTQNVKPWQIEQVHKTYKWHHYDETYDEYLKLKGKKD